MAKIGLLSQKNQKSEIKYGTFQSEVELLSDKKTWLDNALNLIK